MPRRRGRPSNRVLVRHVSGQQKYVARSKLAQLSPNWSRVIRKKKSTTEPSASPSAQTPADPPDSDKENADGLQPDSPGRN